MKKQVQFMLLLMGVSICLLWSCKKDDSPHLTQTTFKMTFTERKAPGIFGGYFDAKGDPTTIGTVTMSVTPVGMDSFHCSQTFVVPTSGTFTILSDCSMSTNTGAWYVVNGTAAYANLEGKGSLVMTTSKAGNVEVLYGNTWRR
jgi:hypothetical protein